MIIFEMFLHRDLTPPVLKILAYGCNINKLWKNLMGLNTFWMH